MLILCDVITNRIKYAVKLMLSDVDTEIGFTISVDEYLLHSGPKMVYSKRETFEEGHIYIHSLGILESSDYARLKIDWSEWRGLPVIFPRRLGNFPFDVFAAGFFLLTRYEEYWRFNGDTMGRYEPQSSILEQRLILEIPIVDSWRIEFANFIIERFPQLKRKSLSFSFLSTIDIDSAYAYLHKGFTRTFGGIAKDVITFHIRNLSSRFKTLSRSKVDPYDTYDYIEQAHLKYGADSMYFFLLADFGEYDKGLPFTSPGLQQLIRRISKKYKVGIHPGVASYMRHSQMLEEKTRLENISGKPIYHSRQHYLMVKFRTTYRMLKATGIEHDYSLGYASKPGFRAGTCRPFVWFDLKKNEESSLTIHPFAYMDATLNYYMQLSVDEAKAKVDELLQTVFEHGGEFISIWHNETLINQGAWQGWREVFEHTLQRGNELTNR
jgi:hypothetical protein